MSATKTGENVNMKKIVLSTLVALSIATVASASDVKLYQDANGQVFTSAADGRTEISTSSSNVSVDSMTKKLDFSMLAYAGYQTTDYRNNKAATKGDLNQFEIRRAYFQVKAHLLEDPKSYFRVTLDASKDANANGDGSYNMRIKYGFLFLNDILPYTGMEAGIAHTTWLDYEENNAWLYRNILETFSEQGNGGKLQASADAGVNFKTNTKYFSSEVGIYNGEGYHGNQPTDTNGSIGMDYEARATVHALGVDGKDAKKTYWDVSLFGKYNARGNKITSGTYAGSYTDTQYIGIHSVFNTEPLLVAAQYINSSDTDKTSTSGIGNVSAKAGSGYSVNFDARMGEKDQYHVFGRYDKWSPTVKSNATKYDQRTYIGGAAWDMNKNVQLVANVITKDNQNVTGKNNDATSLNEYMLTAQVQF
jgi:hypothetical protein